jgi:endoglycosylceramidase
VIGRVLVALLVIVIAVLTYPGALLISLAVMATPPPPAGTGPPGAVSWLHVAHPANGRAYIADDQGRMVLLHGAIPAGLLEFGPGTAPLYPIDPAAYAGGKCPANAAASRYPPICESDLEQMARLGFNSVRLPISWSVLEPERGLFSAMYLDRIAQIVDWARRLRMYVIIDMHQNGYSHYIPTGPHVDLSYLSGAPRWATFTDGVPSQVFQGMRELNPAVFEATTNFWYDRAGIQDEYMAAVAFVARRFVGDSVVAGYGLYNEPWPGWNLSPGFEDLLLFPFYRRLIDAITGTGDGLPCWRGFFLPAVCGYRDLGVDDRRHLMFMDTGLVREVTDFPTHLGLPVSSYPNLALALHAYTHIYTFDALVGQKAGNASYPWGGYDQSYSWAEREANVMRAALFVSEFGNDPADDGLILHNQLLEEERHVTGFAFWTWKENGGNHSWGMFDPKTGCLRAARETLLARVYPRVTADPNASSHYDPGDGRFTMHAAGRAGDPITVVYVPKEVTGQITSEGALRLVVSENEGDGDRLAFGTPTGGRFVITVSAGSLSLGACPG